MANEDPKPGDTNEKFSERPGIKELLGDLKVEIDQKNQVVEAIDQRFESRKSAVLKDSQDARNELAVRLKPGMDTPEMVVEISRIIQEEIIEGEMKAGDLKSLTLTDLLDLEADRPGILLFAFTTWGQDHQAVSIEQFAPYANPSPGTEMIIDFRGNREAYWKVGAGTLLPPQIDVIKVTDAQGKTRIGKRMMSPKNGFYDENGYLPLFDGYKITIATSEEYVGPEPQTESPSQRKLVEHRVDLGDPTGAHRYRAQQTARNWRGEHGERVHPRELDLRRAVPDSWITAGRDASEYYRDAMGVTVDPAVVFAIINRESAFNAGTPNKAGLSSALGLGQFIKGTWEGFVKTNRSIIQTIVGTDPDQMSSEERLKLRTHPILSIYAVTWLAADNARQIKAKEVTPENAAEIYFYHHEGVDGGKRYLDYEKFRTTHSEEQSAELAHLHSWQRSKAVLGPDGKPLRNGKQIIYESGSRYADENLRSLRKISKDVERISQRYHGQLAQPVSRNERTEKTQVIESYRTCFQLDQLAQNPTLSGRTLLIGSSSTTGYGPRLKGAIETDAAPGRSIVTMNERLQKMPLEHLRSFDRIVLQGGVKNTDQNKANITTSLQTIDAMVDYIREKAPNVKIYVTEVTPWNAQYDSKIREFNDHLNSPEFRGKVAGVIPTYSVMDDGRGQLRPAFGPSGKIHVTKYGRYAGVIADWVTRREASASHVDFAQGWEEIETSHTRRTDIEKTISGLNGVETVNDLRALPVEQLIELEAKHEGILFYAFTDFLAGTESLDLEHFEKFYKKPQPGASIKISFRGNIGAEAQIGAGDIFPPSVRRITVYPKGDKSKARTSKRRLGLKGRNDFGTGFYDEQGYIPIYSDDIVVIGGDKNSLMGVKPRFEKQFRTASGELDYEAYEKSDIKNRDRKFLGKMPTSYASGRRSKMTPEEVDQVMAQVEATGSGARVVEAVGQLIKENVRGEHCWDWVNKVYQRAGVKWSSAYKDLTYPGKDCRDRHASSALLDKLQPGDWLYVNNKNRFDSKGNHSLIFLGWIDQSRHIARTASCRKGGTAGVIDRPPRNLDDQPVVHIMKPVVA